MDHRVRDPVDPRQERFRDERDPHVLSQRQQGAATALLNQRVGELLVNTENVSVQRAKVPINHETLSMCRVQHSSIWTTR